jgi:hypothetical protein
MGMSYGTCHGILLDKLSMRLIAAKFVPWILTDDQKQHRLEVSMDLKEPVRNDPDFFPRSQLVMKVGLMDTTLK